MSKSKKENPAKQKKSKSGIFAIVKRRLSKQDVSTTAPQEIETFAAAIDFAAADMEEEDQFEELKMQLQMAHSELDGAMSKIKEDEGIINSYQIQVHSLRNELEESSKLASPGKDGDASLKKEIEDLQKELEKKKVLEKKLSQLTEEVSDLQTQNQELSFQQERSSTRSKMKSINEEKTAKEDIHRFQKELRTIEQTLKIKQSNFDAQLKVAQDGNDRLQEKLKISQSRFDEVDKERLSLKIENNRAQKKLEKAGSFTEKKRLQMEQETAELEMRNLKRKNAKLEKQLISSSNQMLNSGYGESTAGSWSGRSTPNSRPSLGDSKMVNLEKEVTELELALIKMKKENDNLTAKVNSSGQTSEVFTLKVKQLDDQLKTEKDRAQELEADLSKLRSMAAGSSGEQYLIGLQKEIEHLTNGSKEIETKFRVKEKDLWSTIEAQKKKIEELEMEKLALELGEDEEGEEERETTPRPNGESHEKVSKLLEEVEILKMKNKMLEEELQSALQQLQEASEKQNASSMEQGNALAGQGEEVEKLKMSNADLQRSIQESEARSEQLENHMASLQKESTILKTQNEELKKDLEEIRATAEQMTLLQNEIKSLKQENADLGKKLASSQKTSASNDKIKKNLEKAKTTAEQVPVLQKEVAKLKEEKKELTKKVAATEKNAAAPSDAVKKDLDTLRQANSQLIKDLEAAEDEVDHIGDDNEKMKRDVENLKEENKKLRVNLEEAEDEIEKLDTALISQAKDFEGQTKNLKAENVGVPAKKEKTPPKKETTPKREVRETTPIKESNAKTPPAKKETTPKKEVKDKESTPVKKEVKDKESTPVKKEVKQKEAPQVVKKTVKAKPKSSESQHSQPTVTIKTKKVIATGGVKLPVLQNKAEEEPVKTEREEKKKEGTNVEEKEKAKSAEPEDKEDSVVTTEETAAKEKVTDIQMSDVAETQTAPSLTPKFKKPPPAPKKKPSRGSLRQKAEES